jgi:glycosyltransferase involved in cell wall biosynthesis
MYYMEPVSVTRGNAELLENIDILYLSWLDWEHIPLLPQQTATRLAKKNRVLFVDPPYSLATVLFHPYLSRDIVAKSRKWLQGIQSVEQNLLITAFPPLLLQFGFHRMIDRFDQRYLKYFLQRWITSLRMNDVLIWANCPYILDPDRIPGERFVVFDCNDKFSSFAAFSGKLDRLQRLEDEFAANADLVFATSTLLYDEKKRVNPNTHYYPSGVDIEMFLESTREETAIPEDIAHCAHPTLGYYGALDSRMDWQLVQTVSDRFPTCSLVFIGPAKNQPPSYIKENDRIHLLGKRDISSLPGYLKGFDICIIPFLESEFTRYSFPTKIYEFFASGKPVISLDIPAFRALDPLVKVAKSWEEFLEFTGIAIEGLNGEDPLRVKRIMAARGNTWDRRMKETGKLILEGMKQKKADASR